jgi:hypothetical protein
MIDDDDVDARVARHGQRLERLGAAIDGDDQLRPFLGKPYQRLPRRTIALHQPVGDIGFGIGAELAKQTDQQSGGGGAVDVIIAEDGDRLAPLDRVGEPAGRLVHVPEDARIRHEAADGRSAMALQSSRTTPRARSN